MAFLIRHISFTADHREIVRSTPVDKDALTVGRAAENDISLPDLSVEMEHARIERWGDRHIRVTATGTLGFQIDGRTTLQADIDSTRGAELGFGGHRITVTRDAEGNDVLTVRRVAAVSDTAEDRDEATAFSLRGLLPGKRGSAWLVATAILLAFLAWPVWSFFEHDRPDHRNIYTLRADHSWSSGPLSTAHHGLEGNCEACHQKAFVSVRDDACAACHKNVHDHAPPARIAGARAAPGFGGRILASVAHAFGRPGAGACVDCHTEHQGAGPMQPTPQAFCTDCHATLKQRLADTRIGNAGDFGAAHPQFRPLVAVTPGTAPIMARESLDRAPVDASGLKFPHKLHLDGSGGVARMARTLKTRYGFGNALVCADCHKPTADGVRFLPVDMERNCQMCHSLGFDRIGGTVRTLRHGDTRQVMADLRALYRSTGPARPPGLDGMARRRPGVYAQGQIYHAWFGAASARPAGGEAAIKAVFSKGGACFDCHIVTPPGTGGKSDWTVTPVHQPMRYLMHGWFDHNAHRTETCESCHAAAGSTRAEDLLLPDLKSCRFCHGGEASAAKVPSSCAMCHSYHLDQAAPWKSRRRLSPASSAQASLPGARPATE